MKDIINENNSLTIKHYKEPLKAIPKALGHGYYGALLVTLDGTKVQCHVCGKLFGDVGIHSRQAHDLNVIPYREKFELSRTTALISESVRYDRKERTVKWAASLTKAQRREYARRRDEARENYLKMKKKTNSWNIRLETKNKRGTCPDQLLAKIQEVATELGHTPSKREFIVACESQRFVHLIYKTFGSWTKALARLGMTAQVKPQLKGIKHPRYEDEELLDYLTLFKSEHGREPTETDSRRGFIPHTQLYYRRFGSFVRAKELAGVR